jgi:uncharacterized protein YhbP (UPF0306 family)
MDRDPAAVARHIIDTNQYMVVATVNPGGTPWISPVWFAHDGYRAFLWLSRPGRRHSGNVAARPQVAITIFDSTQELGKGFGVTMEAVAAELGGPDLARAAEIVNEKSVAAGGGMFTVEQLGPGGTLRLYRAVATSQYVILGDDERIPIDL